MARGLPWQRVTSDRLELAEKLAGTGMGSSANGLTLPRPVRGPGVVESVASVMPASIIVSRTPTGDSSGCPQSRFTPWA